MKHLTGKCVGKIEAHLKAQGGKRKRSPSPSSSVEFVSETKLVPKLIVKIKENQEDVPPMKKIYCVENSLNKLTGHILKDIKGVEVHSKNLLNNYHHKVTSLTEEYWDELNKDLKLMERRRKEILEKRDLLLTITNNLLKAVDEKESMLKYQITYMKSTVEHLEKFSVNDYYNKLHDCLGSSSEMDGDGDGGKDVVKIGEKVEESGGEKSGEEDVEEEVQEEGYQEELKGGTCKKK